MYLPLELKPSNLREQKMVPIDLAQKKNCLMPKLEKRACRFVRVI